MQRLVVLFTLPHQLPIMTFAVDRVATVREATRDHVDTKIIFRPDVAEMLTSDANLRVMIFCASEPISQFSTVDIAFPHQVEVKVNMDEVKANFRGLKNKSGSTRPADITALLRKRGNYENSLSLTYALTHKVCPLHSLTLRPQKLRYRHLESPLTATMAIEILLCRESGQATQGGRSRCQAQIRQVYIQRASRS